MQRPCGELEYGGFNELEFFSEIQTQGMRQRCDEVIITAEQFTKF